jgi:hypothetical protein
MQQILHCHRQERPPSHHALDIDFFHYRLKLQCTPLYKEQINIISHHSGQKIIKKPIALATRYLSNNIMNHSNNILFKHTYGIRN